METGLPKLGEKHPSFIHGQITLNIRSFDAKIRKEWEQLKPRDVVFLLGIEKELEIAGWSTGSEAQKLKNPLSKFGLRFIRGAEILEVINEGGIYSLISLCTRQFLTLLTINSSPQIEAGVRCKPLRSRHD